MSFTQLGLAAELLSAVNQQGYTTPTPIQQKAIPAILDGRDIIAAAQTGTGKTAGFTLPLLQRLSKHMQSKKWARALILTPTRELAIQVHESVEAYGKHLPLKAMAVFGGVNIKPQIMRLRQHCDIIIATPGRLLDLINQGVLSLDDIEIFVLDEADRMLDMGFIHDIKHILKLLPSQRQSLLFSATYSNEIKALSAKLLRNPEMIEVAQKNTTAELVTQIIYPVDKTRKRELLSYVIGSNNWRQVLVFVRTKYGANRLAKQLETDGLKSAAIHGNKSQGARTRALAEFKSNKIRVLVATDIAARGLDIDKLPFVVNFELPNVPEDYVHRIGRTGRAENEGIAISLVCSDERGFLHSIEKLLKTKLPEEIISGFEPDQSIKAETIKLRHSQSQKRTPSQKTLGKKRKNGRPQRQRAA